MVNEKQLEKAMLCIEDAKSLYATLEQSEQEYLVKQEFKSMLQDLEKHYLCLNSKLLATKNKTKSS